MRIRSSLVAFTEVVPEWAVNLPARVLLYGSPTQRTRFDWRLLELFFKCPRFLDDSTKTAVIAHAAATAVTVGAVGPS